MNKHYFIPLVIYLFVTMLCLQSRAYGFGLSFSYFIPQHGYISAPMVPVALKDMGYRFGNAFAVSSSLSVYSVGGMNIKNLPFDAPDPLMGPFHSAVATLTPQLIIPVKQLEFRLSGGLFGFYNFNENLQYGYLDRALADYKDWDALTSSFEYDNRPGWGITYGGTVTYYLIGDHFGITAGVMYYEGGSNLNIRGAYVGGNMGETVQREYAHFRDAKLDFRGYEVMVGVSFSLSGQSGDEVN